MTTQQRAIGAVAAGLFVYGVCAIGEKMMTPCQNQKQYKPFSDEPQPQDNLLADVFHGVRHADWSTDEHGPLVEEKTTDKLTETSSGTGMDTSVDITTSMSTNVITADQTADALATLDK